MSAIAFKKEQLRFGDNNDCLEKQNIIIFQQANHAGSLKKFSSTESDFCPTMGESRGGGQGSQKYRVKITKLPSQHSMLAHYR